MKVSVKVDTKGLSALIKGIDKLDKDVATEFFERVKRRTPVITGRLRDGWQLKTTNTSFTVSNAVPYADFVENGTPKMAPRGMLKTTVSELTDIVNTFLQRIK